VLLRGSAAPRRPVGPLPPTRSREQTPAHEHGHRPHPQRDPVVRPPWAVLRARFAHASARPRPREPPPPAGPRRRGEPAPPLSSLFLARRTGATPSPGGTIARSRPQEERGMA